MAGLADGAATSRRRAIRRVEGGIIAGAARCKRAGKRLSRAEGDLERAGGILGARGVPGARKRWPGASREVG